MPEEDRPTVIFSSPYYRCIQTAEPISRALNVPVFIEHGISEWYSPRSFPPGSPLVPGPGSAASLQAFFPDLIDASWESVYYPSGKGESVEELHDRTAAFLKAFFEETDKKWKGERKKILLVSHAAPIITLLHELAGDREIPMKVGLCSLSEAHPPDSLGGNWTITRLSWAGFMKEGVQRPWGFEDYDTDVNRTIAVDLKDMASYN